LFELQLEEAQGVKINELKQQMMMNISGQMDKVGRVYFSVFDLPPYQSHQSMQSFHKLHCSKI
jgi:hypothetical protein